MKFVDMGPFIFPLKVLEFILRMGNMAVMW